MSVDATISTADTELGDRSILPLNANETREWSLPALDAPSTAGTYHFGACVDPLAEESDQQNNCSTAVTVSVGGPDLVVDSLAVSEAGLSAGQRFTLTARVLNQGEGASIDLTRLRFYLSADATISTADTELGDRPILPPRRERDPRVVPARPDRSNIRRHLLLRRLRRPPGVRNRPAEQLLGSVEGEHRRARPGGRFLALSETSLSAGQRFSMARPSRTRARAPASTSRGCVLQVH